jgi:hypothetical protein
LWSKTQVDQTEKLTAYFIGFKTKSLYENGGTARAQRSGMKVLNYFAIVAGFTLVYTMLKLWLLGGRG